MTKSNNYTSQKEDLYIEISSHFDKLPIARYLKNEAKDTLKYFHKHKLTNLKNNLADFSEYLLFLNQENCQKIESFISWKETQRTLNNSISYFYENKNSTEENLNLIQSKIETNSYETIALMQSLKWCLILTIDEFCNASPTRVDIIRYELGKKKAKCKT